MSGKNRLQKTNAMRILDSCGIPYKTSVYDDDTEHKLELGAAAVPLSA